MLFRDRRKVYASCMDKRIRSALKSMELNTDIM
jgi:hypothetical protein